MNVELEGYASESIAGLQACQGVAGTIHCVIDFGGGTTDIAIQATGQNARTTLEPLFVDSLKLAGNDVLGSLLADQDLRKAILGDSAPEAEEEEFALARQIVLRDLRTSLPNQLPNFWNNLLGEFPGAAERFASRNRALFDGVLAYTVILLSEAEKHWRKDQPESSAPPEVSVFLLGQGWGLLYLQGGKGSHKPEVYVKRRLEELRRQLPGHLGTYNPANVFKPGRAVKSPKLATAYGAIKLSSRNIQIAHEAMESVGRDTVFGLNVEFADGNKLTADSRLEVRGRPMIHEVVKSHDAWEAFIGPLLAEQETSEHVRSLFGSDDRRRIHYVKTVLNSKLQSRLGAQLREAGPLRASALGILLEEIWARQLREATPRDD
jgi:hypothetical protein